MSTISGGLDPTWPKRKITRKKMNEINLIMAAAVARTHAYFLAQRSTHARQPAQPQRRSAEKVGCNEPCLCGSGLKFKMCCGRQGAEGLQ